MERLRFSVLLANALIDAGNYTRASELLGHAIASTAESRDPILRARLWWSQSRLHEMQGDSETAAQYGRRALETLELTEHTTYAARAHQMLAHIELDRGHADEALDLLEAGYPLIEQSGNRLRAGDVQARAGACLRAARPQGRSRADGDGGRGDCSTTRARRPRDGRTRSSRRCSPTWASATVRSSSTSWRPRSAPRTAASTARSPAARGAARGSRAQGRGARAAQASDADSVRVPLSVSLSSSSTIALRRIQRPSSVSRSSRGRARDSARGRRRRRRGTRARGAARAPARGGARGGGPLPSTATSFKDPYLPIVNPTAATLAGWRWESAC